MKKMMTLALVALLATAAHAVTVTWSNMDSTGNRGNSRLAEGADFTMNLSATTVKEGSTVTLYSITLVQTTWTDETLTATSLAFNYGTSSQVTSSSYTTGTVTVGGATYTSLTYTFTNGVEVVVGQSYAVTALDASGVRYSNLESSAGYLSVRNSTGSDLLGSTLTSSYTPLYTIVAEADESVLLVPEPTCLALLALGVAGLALRRKA